MVVLLRLIVVLAVGYGLWRLLRPTWAFEIVADETGVRSHRGITTPQQRRLLDVIYRMRFVEGRVRIRGRCDHHGQLQLSFTGQVSDETRQQIRNYIVNEL